MAEIIDSLKRLERAGSENSRATKKLHEAAETLAQQIIKLVPEDTELPRGYQVRRISSNVGQERFLTYQQVDPEWGEPVTNYVDGTGNYLHGDFHCWIPPQTRETSLTFAKDIANGWLDELAAWLEARTAEADGAAETLRRASEAAQGKEG